MTGVNAVCPHPECGASIPVPRKLINGGPKPCLCRCHRIKLVPIKDGDVVTLHRLVAMSERRLRKGDRVLVARTYHGVHGSGQGEYFTVDTLTRGGKSPRDKYGAPLDLGKVVGIIEEVSP